MKPEPATSESTDSQGGTPRRSRWWLAGFIMVGALCAAAALWYTRVFEPERAQIRDAVASSDRAYTGLGAEVQVLRQTVADSEAAREDAASRVAKLEAALAALTSRLAALDTTTDNNLKLARAAHLVAMAEATLRFERNTANAAAALDVALQAIGDTTDPAYAALKSALVADRDALLATQVSDVAALAAEWAAAETTVEALAWRTPPYAASNAPGAPDAPLAGWQGVAVAIWRDLKNLVEVRDLGVADAALLDPGHEMIIKDRLRSELATLRLAIYRRDTVNARGGAARARVLLAKYFDDPIALRLNQRLTELETLELAPALPELEATRTALEYLEIDGRGLQLPVPTISPSASL